MFKIKEKLIKIEHSYILLFTIKIHSLLIIYQNKMTNEMNPRMFVFFSFAVGLFFGIAMIETFPYYLHKIILVRDIQEMQKGRALFDDSTIYIITYYTNYNTWTTKNESYDTNEHIKSLNIITHGYTMNEPNKELLLYLHVPFKHNKLEKGIDYFPYYIDSTYKTNATKKIRIDNSLYDSKYRIAYQRIHKSFIIGMLIFSIFLIVLLLSLFGLMVWYIPYNIKKLNESNQANDSIERQRLINETNSSE